MKTILVWLWMLIFAASPTWAQDTATQQQLDKLGGQIQDLIEAQAQQGRRIDALERAVGELREKMNTPVVNDSASREDLKKLAEQIQEIDRKRQDDRELILKQIENLGRAAAVTPLPSPRQTTRTPKTSPEDTGTSSAPLKGYEYEIKPGDNLGLIIKAYREQGVKVTKSQIIKANPKMNPDVLIPGKKIFIPDPSAK